MASNDSLPPNIVPSPSPMSSVEDTMSPIRTGYNLLPSIPNMNANSNTDINLNIPSTNDSLPPQPPPHNSTTNNNNNDVDMKMNNEEGADDDNNLLQQPPPPPQQADQDIVINKLLNSIHNSFADSTHGDDSELIESLKTS